MSDISHKRGLKMDLPKSIPVLILGICSIAFSSMGGIVAGIIAIVMSSKSLEVYEKRPANFTASSYKRIKAGRKCAVIGTIISAVFMLLFLFYIIGIIAFVTGMIGGQAPEIYDIF